MTGIAGVEEVVVVVAESVGRLYGIITSMGGDSGRALSTKLFASVLAISRDPVTDCRLLYTFQMQTCHAHSPIRGQGRPVRKGFIFVVGRG